MVGGDVRHGQAFDIIAARGEQAGDLGEYPGLVVDDDGEHMALASFGGDFHVFTPPPAGGRGRGWSARNALLPLPKTTPRRPRPNTRRCGKEWRGQWRSSGSH